MTELGRQSYSIDAVNEFDPFFLELSSFCKLHELGVETLIHEACAGQMEINFAHGDALGLADRVFLFKRAMHVHQSVVDAASGRNIFTAADGGPSELFFHFIGRPTAPSTSTAPCRATWTTRSGACAGAGPCRRCWAPCSCRRFAR